jgi:two-component system, OmpR family, sensor histidine kinase KdpD
MGPLRGLGVPDKVDPPAERIDSGIRREARVVGLRGFSTPSLEAVERRRMQLWVMSTGLLIAFSLGVVALSTWPAVWNGTETWVPPSILRISIVYMAIAFCAYSIEKEVHLHRLSKMLVDERVLSTALTNRLHEVSLLLESGRAINSVLDLQAVLDTILTSAAELLGGVSGSIMLVEGDELVTAAAQGNEAAHGARMQIGEGIAGQVAQSSEPLLIDGQADPGRFPGLLPRSSRIDSAMSTPLIHRGDVVGVLNVNAAPGRVFTEYDLRAMSVFAEQAASAISNARMYEAERQHVSELMRLDKLKGEFVALVTHELRTPITSILAANSLRRRPEMLDQREEMDDIVERQARRLDGMVEDLLAAGRMERSESPPRIEAVDIASLVRRAVSDAVIAGLDVSVDGPESALVRGDEEWLRRVFDNLLDNARKYGAPPVHVRIGAGQGTVLVSVDDNGPGVPEAQRDRVFERFQRLEAGTGQPGLGLGLSIVRGLLRRLNGDVWLQEAPGGGASFVVSIPEAQESRKAV